MTDNWTGLPEHTCGDHYSVGGRAWCHDCSEWCYPDMPCFRCCIPLIREVLAAARGVVAERWVIEKAGDGENSIRYRSDEEYIAALEAERDALAQALKAADDAGATP